MSNIQWNAEDYAVNSLAQQNWAQELIAKMALSGNEALLDIGCGDGKISAEIAKKLVRGRVTGIDASPQMINLATRLTEDVPNLDFICMDAKNITLTHTFDIAYSNAALHWVDDHLAMLQGVYACLGTNGRLCFQMGGKGNAAEIIASADEIIARPEWSDYFTDFSFPYKFYDDLSYCNLLVHSGFEPTNVQLIDKLMRHQSVTSLEGWIRTTWMPYTQRVPSNKRDHFIHLVASNYLEKYPPDASGAIQVAMVRLEVHAKKQVNLNSNT